jgi:hypothetical protein
MNFVSLFQSFLNSTDTLMQVMATLYVAVAIFAGEQISSTLNKQSSPIRLKPMRYVEYLHLPTAAVCIPLPIILAHLQSVDFFPGWESAPLVKVGVLAAACFFLEVKLLIATFDALLQAHINVKYHNITDSVTRLVAWALDKEDEDIEKAKIIISLMSRENDYNLERQILRHLQDSLDNLLEHPNPNKATIFIGSLRAFRTNFDKRPLDRPQYYQQYFELVHTGWYRAFSMREELHKANVYQVSGTLAKSARTLLTSSLGPRSLGYEYFQHLKTFLEDDTKKQENYFQRIGDSLLLQISASPDSTLAWSEYFPHEWEVSTQTIKPKEQSSVPLILFKQYTQLVNKVQREESGLETQMEDISYHLFPNIHTSLWTDLITLRYQYWPGTTAEEHLRFWLAHPKKFGFAAFGETIDFSVSDKHKRVQKVFDDLKQGALELAATLALFPPEELQKLISAANKLLKESAELERDYYEAQLLSIKEALQELLRLETENNPLDK